jgi:hypothetical protein
MPRKMLFLAIATLAVAPAGRAAAETPDDRAAAQQIAQDLKASGQLRDYRVGVKCQDGVAWLMGTVTSAEQSRTAERLASQSPGVDRVINKLEIAKKPQPAVDVQQASVDSAEYEEPTTPVSRPMPVRSASGNMPVPYARLGQGPVQQATFGAASMGGVPAGGYVPTGMGQAVTYDSAQMPGYAWPSYAAYPNYAAVTYPQQYSPTAWPYIGPFYPYPQVPLGWRKVTLEWDDGWWFLDFKDQKD